MKTLILDGLFVYKDLPKCFDNSSSLEIIFEKAKKNNFDRYVLLQNGKITDVPEGIKNVVIEDVTPLGILNAIQKESKNSETTAIYNAGSPFYDESFMSEMLERHDKYIADYTYGIGYPSGLIPQIIRNSILLELISLVENSTEITKDYIFYSLSKDINSFDIETFLSDFDLRIFRINLGLNDNGEELITQKAYSIFNKDYSVNKIVEYFNENQTDLYTTIYLLTLELTNYSPVKSIYYPEINEEKKEMDLESAKKILNWLKTENENAYVILGGIGEPLLYNNLSEIIKTIHELKLNLIIETNGINITPELLDIFNAIKDRVTFVLKLDAYHEDTYKKIHLDGDFNTIIKSISLLQENGFKVYKQIIRMNENEVEIEKYIKEKKVDNLIIRKYSTFCDMLPDKKVVDLSPLERIPCFHLRREIYVKADGTVPICMYSRYKDTIGNINSDNFDTIKNKLNELYISNVKKEYRDFCKNCNDYYLFNF